MDHHVSKFESLTSLQLIIDSHVESLTLNFSHVYEEIWDFTEVRQLARVNFGRIDIRQLERVTCDFPEIRRLIRMNLF